MNRRKLFLIGGVGNSIEVFEAIVYAFLQPFITKTFFPSNLQDNNLLFFLTIILPFLARPIGAFLFGLIGDVQGRKSVLEYSLILSGISCAAIAFVPSYESAGLFSFFSIIFLRFVFGLAMSGEYNNSFLYLAEQSAPLNRGYILSWAAFGVSFGIFLAALVAFFFTHLVEKQVLPVDAFRSLFLFSTFTLYIGYLARRDMSETAEYFISFPAFEKNKTKIIYKIATKDIVARLPTSIKIILLSGFGTHITYSLLLYAPFHLKAYNVNSILFKDATLLVAVSACISAIVIPMVGRASDLIGRKILLMISLISITILYLLFFYVVAGNCSYQELLFFYIIIGFFNAIYFCTAPAEIIDSLPNRMRSTVNGLLYGVPAVMFGALSLPYFQTQFQRNAHSPLIILIMAIPLFLFFCCDRKKLFSTAPSYEYPLEVTKVH